MQRASEQGFLRAPGAPPPLKVMVIEDDDLLGGSLQQLLEGEGHEVTCCLDAPSALARLRQGALPEVIILDLHLPGMNGWEFRIEQRREPSWSSIPIIALSADRSAQAQAIDAVAYIGKPIDEALLLATVQRVGTKLQQARVLARAREVQRLVSLGSLIGGIAHEINNPLAIADSSLEIVQLQLQALVDPSRSLPFDLARAERALERTKVGLERIAAVVRCVSLFASTDDQSLEPLDVRRVLESSMQVASNEIRHCAVLERSFELLPPVLGNAAKLGQVFLNLLLNAVFAIRQSQVRDHRIGVSARAEGDSVVVTFSDTASYIRSSAVQSPFDPLAPVTSGSMELHFDLAVSRELVEGMGGTIEAEQVAPTGANFRVRLPRCSEVAPEQPEVPKPSVPLRPRRPSLMLIDDDPLMCEVLSAVLLEHYDVSAFASPRAALAVLLEGQFDLILCDVMMPELNGMDLYERTIRERPELTRRFVFITGGAFTERARSFLKHAAAPTVQKPFGKATLLAIVASTLESVRTGDKQLS